MNLPIWLRLTLFGSLALNLVVLGLIVGLAWQFGGKPRPAPIAQAGGAYTHALDHADRRALFQKLRNQPGEMPSRRDAQASFEAVLAALRADPFEAQALRAAMLAQHALFDRRAEQGQAVLIEHLSQMSPAERVAYADRLETALKQRRSRRPPESR